MEGCWFFYITDYDKKSKAWNFKIKKEEKNKQGSTLKWIKKCYYIIVICHLYIDDERNSFIKDIVERGYSKSRLLLDGAIVMWPPYGAKIVRAILLYPHPPFCMQN